MNTSIMKYNPAFLSSEELVENFVVRQAELELILQVVQENTDSANQHVLAIGPRGIGKTMLVLRAAEEVRRREDLGGQWYPLVFSEESYRVTTAGEFWHEAIFHLAQQTNDESWRVAYDELQGEKDETRLRERALAQLMDFADSQHKRLLLVVENLNMLLGEQMADDQGWVLRHTLLHEPRVMLLATATSRFEQIDNAGKPMFELFRTIELEPLDEDDCRRMWTSISGMEPTDRHIRPIQILTGGNPRLVAIISSFGARMSFKELMADLIQLVDDHTEYFKSHLDSLPPIERKVYLSLVELWDPSPARKVAENARLDVNKTSSLLRRLRERGAVVEANGKGRSKLYQVAERLYNIYYLMRRHGAPSQRVRAVVNFMVAFYGEKELLDVVRRLAGEACDLSPEARADHYLAYEQILRCSSIDRLREKIMQLTPSKFLNAADIPASLKDMIAAETALELLGPVRLPEGSGAELAEAKVMFDKGLALAEQKQYGEAIHAFDAIGREHGNTDDVEMKLVVVKALHNKGMLLLRQGRPAEVQAMENEFARRAAEIEEDNARARMALDLLKQGDAFAKEERYKEAVASYDEIVDRFSDAREKLLLWAITRAMLSKADVLCAAKRYGQAIEAFRIALAFDPERYDAALSLAALLEQEGQAGDALELFGEVLRRPELIEKNVSGTIERLISLAAKGYAGDLLGLLRESPSAELLEPLVVGLRLYLGEDVKAATEIMEVAKDVVQRIEEKRKSH